MIKLNKIEEWIREVEERPSSASVIIRYIANRLSELSSRNEELLAENIELRTNRRVEEYENRIANLEYQLDLLKRQVGGEVFATLPAAETISLVIYNRLGEVLRVEQAASGLTPGALAAAFSGSLAWEDAPPRLLAATTTEELLFVFDSGRTAAVPVSAIPAVGGETLSWEQAHLQEPRGGEELASILPVATMSLFDFCVQTSRRGYVKKIRESAFESHLTNDYIGTGVKLPADKTCSLALVSTDDLLVLVSKDGYLLGVEVGKLPFTIEEVMKLSAADHIITTFPASEKASLMVITQNGKAIHREAGWLEPAPLLKGRGQPVFSQAKRDAGVRVAGAASAGPSDWCAALTTDGKLALHKTADLFASGVVPLENPESEILSFVVFSVPTDTTTGRE